MYTKNIRKTETEFVNLHVKHRKGQLSHLVFLIKGSQGPLRAGIKENSFIWCIYIKAEGLKNEAHANNLFER